MGACRKIAGNLIRRPLNSFCPLHFFRSINTITAAPINSTGPGILENKSMSPPPPLPPVAVCPPVVAGQRLRLDTNVTPSGQSTCDGAPTGVLPAPPPGAPRGPPSSIGPVVGRPACFQACLLPNPSDCQVGPLGVAGEVVGTSPGMVRGVGL